MTTRWIGQTELVAWMEFQTTPSEADVALLLGTADGLQGEYEEFVGRKILAADAGAVTEFFDGGCDRLSPSVTPLKTVSEIRTSRVGLREFGDDTLTPAGNYSVVDDSIYLTWTPEPEKRSLRVTYTGGYDSLPLDLKRVFLQNVRQEWKRRRDSGEGLTTVSAGGASVSSYKPFQITAEAQRVLLGRYYAKDVFHR